MQIRTLVIGDIHGMYDELIRVLEHVDYKDSDKFVFLGDYINRGRQSKDVLNFMIELKSNPENVFLKGNHEFVMLKLADGHSDFLETWLERGGGKNCLLSYGMNPDYIQKNRDLYFHITNKDGRKKEEPLDNQLKVKEFIFKIFPPHHIEFMKDTTAKYETDEFFFSHAGIEKGIKLSEQMLHSMLLGDESFLTDRTDYGKVIVFGHWHWKKPLVMFKKIGIGLNDAVAVLDLQNMVIVDSNGNHTEVSNEK